MGVDFSVQEEGDLELEWSCIFSLLKHEPLTWSLTQTQRGALTLQFVGGDVLYGKAEVWGWVQGGIRCQSPPLM